MERVRSRDVEFTCVDEQNGTDKAKFSVTEVEKVEDVGKFILFKKQVTKRHLMDELSEEN